MSGGNFFDFFEKHSAKRRGKPAPNAEPGPANSREMLTVGQLTQRIDAAIKSGLPATVHVQGELSNVNAHRASGHLYFTLKDEIACIDCVMWKSDVAKLKFEPSDGQQVLVSGGVQVYGARGRYQLYARRIEPMGRGALELAFRQLCAKLETEGLFDPERKKPLPAYPMNVALVTSRQTAALQDMLKVLRRFAWLKIALFHVPVQGDGSAEKIAEAIELLNREADRGRAIDVIVLARGGGSLEDLWEFNEEIVARAIAASTIPIVTGIGHEVDTSIADLVADYHAHTPTEAAQVITAQWRTAADALDMTMLRARRGMRNLLDSARQQLGTIERHAIFRRPTDRIDQLKQRLDDRQRGLQLAISRRVRELHRRIEASEKRLARHHPSSVIAQIRSRLERVDRALMRAASAVLRRGDQRITRLAARLAGFHPYNAVRLNRQRIDQLQLRLEAAVQSAMQRQTMRLSAIESQMNALSPLAVLQRGYSITTLKRSGQVIRSVNTLHPGDKLLTRLADGEIESVVEDRNQPKLFE